MAQTAVQLIAGWVGDSEQRGHNSVSGEGGGLGPSKQSHAPAGQRILSWLLLRQVGVGRYWHNNVTFIAVLAACCGRGSAQSSAFDHRLLTMVTDHRFKNRWSVDRFSITTLKSECFVSGQAQLHSSSASQLPVFLRLRRELPGGACHAQWRSESTDDEIRTRAKTVRWFSTDVTFSVLFSFLCSSCLLGLGRLC